MRDRIVGLAAVVMVVLSVGCRGRPVEWRSLWSNEWSWYANGVEWARGVPVVWRQVEADHSCVLRGRVLNQTPNEVTVRLSGRDEREWRLSGGQSMAIETPLKTGAYNLSAPAGVVLANPRLGTEAARPRTVVVVVVDTLRADHVRRELMPRVLSYFKAGTRWTDATANGSWTLPSMTSLFTSRPVLDLTTPEGDLIGVADGLPTWASCLEEAGFSGAAVVANYSIAVLNGFGPGFTSFWVPDGHGKDPHPDATWVVSRAREWLAGHAGEDVFLYLHFMDPHHPYRSHRDPDVKTPELRPLALRERPASPEERELLQRLYGEEVAHVDEVLGPFLEELPRNALVLLTADHGESLGEHECWGHGLNLYQENIRVPLMARGPGVRVGEDPRPVQLLDVGPTVLELAGVQPGSGMVGRSLASGTPGEEIVAATFGAGPLRWAWRHGRHKVILHTQAQPGLGAEARTRAEEREPLPSGVQVFDLASDPSEEKPLELRGALLEECGKSFARSAGRMVPGLQLMLWGHEGGADCMLTLPGAVEVIQAWSVSPMEVERSGDRLAVHCRDAFPVCALAAWVEPRPTVLTAPQDARIWGGLTDGAAVSLGVAPEGLSGDGDLWWNSERPMTVGGQQQTLERLRALGYID
jgi:arylsulfatase A-like enzyme